ncbi:MAG: hypothetical protein WBA88_19090 [Pseudaminobacter sp.]
MARRHFAAKLRIALKRKQLVVAHAGKVRPMLPDGRNPRRIGELPKTGCGRIGVLGRCPPATLDADNPVNDRRNSISLSRAAYAKSAGCSRRPCWIGFRVPNLALANSDGKRLVPRLFQRLLFRGREAGCIDRAIAVRFCRIEQARIVENLRLPAFQRLLNAVTVKGVALVELCARSLIQPFLTCRDC